MLFRSKKLMFQLFQDSCTMQKDLNCLQVKQRLQHLTRQTLSFHQTRQLLHIQFFHHPPCNSEVLTSNHVFLKYCLFVFQKAVLSRGNLKVDLCLWWNTYSKILPYLDMIQHKRDNCKYIKCSISKKIKKRSRFLDFYMIFNTEVMTINSTVQTRDAFSRKASLPLAFV